MGGYLIINGPNQLTLKIHHPRGWGHAGENKSLLPSHPGCLARATDTGAVREKSPCQPAADSISEKRGESQEQQKPNSGAPTVDSSLDKPARAPPDHGSPANRSSPSPAGLGAVGVLSAGVGGGTAWPGAAAGRGRFAGRSAGSSAGREAAGGGSTARAGAACMGAGGVAREPSSVPRSLLGLLPAGFDLRAFKPANAASELMRASLPFQA